MGGVHVEGGGQGRGDGWAEGGDQIALAVEVELQEGEPARGAAEVGGGVGWPDLVDGDGSDFELAAGQGGAVEIADGHGDRRLESVAGPMRQPAAWTSRRPGAMSS